MTTIAVVGKNGYAAMAADTLTKWGTGTDVALGAMYAAHDNPHLSAKQVARLAIEAAAELGDATGLPVVSHTVRLKTRLIVRLM